MLGKNCRVCGELLTVSNQAFKTSGNICRPCIYKHDREYGKLKGYANRNNQKKNYMRANFLGQRVDGKSVYIKVENKRPYTDHCEMCGRANTKIIYHHWDDTDYSKGLWLCQVCHNTAHVVENNLHTKYLQLKETIK